LRRPLEFDTNSTDYTGGLSPDESRFTNDERDARSEVRKR